MKLRLVLSLAATALIVLNTRSLLATTSAVEPVTIDLNVVESSGTTRTNAAVTTGVPIPIGTTSAAWSMFDGTTEIPLQTTVLPNREKPWLLLDFQTSVTANGTKSLVLKQQTGAVAPTQPITISEDPSQITVDTGELRTQLSKTDFNLLDTVWLDQNDDQSYDAGELVVTPAVSSNLTIADVGSGTTFSGRGLPSAIAWEDRGPLRATLRIDGAYTNGPTTLLTYTTRLTWYAGRTDVVVEQVLRNSYEPQERYIKVSSAKLDIGTTSTTDRIARSGDLLWANVESGGKSLELVPPTLVVSTTYDPYANPPVNRANSTIDVDSNGGMIIGDLSYHSATFHLDFGSGLSVGEKSLRTASAKDPLMAMADDDWYSAMHAFGGRHISSYDDEKNAYTKWGWTWPTPGNQLSYEHDLPRVPSIYPTWSVLDSSNDPESDDLWQNVVMYARTQRPFFLDRARGWARYWKSEWTFRTDGFAFQGAWENFWDGPAQVHRLPIIQPSLTANDTAYIDHNIKYGKAGVSHMWNGGAIDYYYLTGDRDALTAAIDTAERCRKQTAWVTPGSVNAQVGGNARYQGRCLLILVRAWETTNDPQWKTAADHLIQILLQSTTTYDERGFFGAPVSALGSAYVSRFPGDNAVYFSPFMMTTVVEGLYQYYVLTNDPAVQTMILQMAAFSRDHSLDPNTYYGGDYIVVDSPNPGDIIHASYSHFRGTTPVYPNTAGAIETGINAMVIGYRLTGDRSYLHQAKYFWNQGSKRNYVDPYEQRFATDSQVGRFVLSLQAWGPNGLLFPEGGDLTSVSYLFYEAARLDEVAPAAVNDLSAP